MADALELIATTGGVLTAGLGGGGGGYGDDAGQRPPTFGDLGLDAIPAPEDLEGRRGGKGDGNGPAPTSPAGPRRYRRPQRQPRSPADASDSLAALSQLVLVSAPGAARGRFGGRGADWRTAGVGCHGGYEVAGARACDDRAAQSPRGACRHVRASCRAWLARTAQSGRHKGKAGLRQKKWVRPHLTATNAFDCGPLRLIKKG